MENLASLNLNKICRVCLLEAEQMYSIYSELYEDQAEIQVGDSPCIYEILISISSMRVQANDGLPSLICAKCIDMADTSFKFQKQCNNSQIILDAYLKETPTISTITDDFNNLEQIHKNTENGDFLLMAESSINAKDEMSDEGVSSEFVDPIDVTNAHLSEEITASSERVKDKKFACLICDKSYKSSNNLHVHMRNHMDEKPYQCKTCGKSFKQHGSLWYHLRSHTGEQPYVCKLCGKRYKQSATLTAHMRVHTGQKPFLCSICGKGFRQAADLGYHMRFHTKERPYMCNVCGKTMTMQSHLRIHMRIHTGERPYKCSVCEKAFPSSTCLKRHAIVHTNLKPYTCEVCSKSFNRMSTLKVHAKIHTDERSHVCPICSKGFIQAHALRSHLASHSSELITAESSQFST